MDLRSYQSNKNHWWWEKSKRFKKRGRKYGFYWYSNIYRVFRKKYKS